MHLHGTGSHTAKLQNRHDMAKQGSINTGVINRKRTIPRTWRPRYAHIARIHKIDIAVECVRRIIWGIKSEIYPVAITIIIIINGRPVAERHPITRTIGIKHHLFIGITVIAPDTADIPVGVGSVVTSSTHPVNPTTMANAPIATITIATYLPSIFCKAEILQAPLPST